MRNQAYCMFEAIQRTELCETCRVTPDLVSQYQIGMEQLVHLVWERTTKRHTTEKAPGEKTNFPPHKLKQLGSSQTRRECRPTGNIHMLRLNSSIET